MRLTKMEEMDSVLAETVDIANSRIGSPTSQQLEYASPAANERAIFEIIQDLCAREFTADSVEHIGGHKFPDIIFPYADCGVEIKGHKSQSDYLLGNSIMGSTFSIENPKAIRLIVWSEASGSVAFYDYFESVIGAEVTHSPRFRLKPGAAIEERLFGNGAEHLGPAEEICLGGSGIDHEKILARMRVQALAKGNLPWWISEDYSMAKSDDLSISRISNLSDHDRLAIESIATFVFPEVMGGQSSSKYRTVTAWAIATRGVLITRDNFSAGGKVAIEMNTLCVKHPFVVPKSFANGIMRLSRHFELSISELRLYWGLPFLQAGEVAREFRKMLHEINFESVVESVTGSLCSSCKTSESELTQEIREFVVSQLNFKII
jgi:hypothetical protein